MAADEPRRRSLVRSLALRLILRGRDARKRQKFIKALALLVIVASVAMQADAIQALLLGTSRPQAPSIAMPKLPSIPSLSLSGGSSAGRTAAVASAGVPPEMEAAARVGTLLTTDSGSGAVASLPAAPTASLGVAALDHGLHVESELQPASAGSASEGNAKRSAMIAPPPFPDAMPDAVTTKTTASNAAATSGAGAPAASVTINCVAGCGRAQVLGSAPLAANTAAAPIDRAPPCVAGCMPSRTR